jgi:hypothetical protein
VKSDKEIVPGTVSDGRIMMLGFVRVNSTGKGAWVPSEIVTFEEGDVGSDGPNIGVYCTPIPNQ